jgi:predicted dehydrogenase
MTTGARNPLRAGVIGVGHLGRHHARLFATLPGTRLVGVVDSDRSRAEEIARRHDARVFDDPESLAREVDLASVAASTTAHEELAAPLLDAGVATLVEKPIAADTAAGARLVELARSKGVPLAVGHIERSNPAVAALAERVREPRFLEIHRLAPFKPRSLDVDVVLDLMIHDLDLCRFLLPGAEVVSLDASGTAALTDHIDIASVRIRFDNGAAANITASRISLEPVRRLRVFERGSYLSCDTGNNRLAVFRVDRSDPAAPQVKMEPVDVPVVEPLAAELSAFVAAVRDGGPVPCSGEDGLRALELALTIRDVIRGQG